MAHHFFSRRHTQTLADRIELTEYYLSQSRSIYLDSKDVEIRRTLNLYREAIAVFLETEHRVKLCLLGFTRCSVSRNAHIDQLQKVLCGLRGLERSGREEKIM